MKMAATIINYVDRIKKTMAQKKEDKTVEEEKNRKELEDSIKEAIDSAEVEPSKQANAVSTADEDAAKLEAEKQFIIDAVEILTKPAPPVNQGSAFFNGVGITEAQQKYL
jgi:hypothetical protein